MASNAYSYIRANFIPVVVYQQDASTPAISLPDWLSSAYINLYDNVAQFSQYQVSDADLGNPDLIAYLMYGQEQYDWLIMDFNGIVDPYNDLYIGQVLRIPDLQQALAYLKQQTGLNVTSNLNQVVTI
jgi:hypothetical protein